MAAAAKVPSPRQSRPNFAACAIPVASLLPACTVWLSTDARIAEQSPVRFGLPNGTLKVSGPFVRQLLSNPKMGISLRVLARFSRDEENRSNGGPLMCFGRPVVRNAG